MCYKRRSGRSGALLTALYTGMEEERREMESLMKETMEGWQEMEGKGQGGICGR